MAIIKKFRIKSFKQKKPILKLENVEKEIVVHSSCHFGVKKEYRYTKLFIDDSHEIIFDLNDENNLNDENIVNYSDNIDFQ